MRTSHITPKKNNLREISEFSGKILTICGSTSDTWRLRHLYKLNHPRELIYNLNIAPESYPDLIADCTSEGKSIPLPKERFSVVYFSGMPIGDDSIEIAFRNAFTWLKEDGLLIYRGRDPKRTAERLTEMGYQVFSFVRSDGINHLDVSRNILMVFKNNKPVSAASLCAKIPGLREVMACAFSVTKNTTVMSPQEMELNNKTKGNSELDFEEIDTLSSDKFIHIPSEVSTLSLREIDNQLKIVTPRYNPYITWSKIVFGVAALAGGIFLLTLGSLPTAIIGAAVALVGVGLFAYGVYEKKTKSALISEPDSNNLSFSVSSLSN